MNDEMYLVITLRKIVPDRDRGKEIFDLVVQRMQDRPDILVTGHVTNHFEFTEE